MPENNPNPLNFSAKTIDTFKKASGELTQLISNLSTAAQNDAKRIGEHIKGDDYQYINHAVYDLPQHAAAINLAYRMKLFVDSFTGKIFSDAGDETRGHYLKLLLNVPEMSGFDMFKPKFEGGYRPEAVMHLAYDETLRAELREKLTEIMGRVCEAGAPGKHSRQIVERKVNEFLARDEGGRG